MVFLIAESEPVQDKSSTTTAIGDLRQIAALLEGLRALGTGRVLDDVLSLVLDAAIDVSSAERGVHHAGVGQRRARVQDGARTRTHHAAGRHVRDEPEDPGRGVPHRRTAARGRPARRRARERSHGHGGARHPQRPVRAAAARAVSRQGGSGRRGAPDRRAVPGQPREGAADVELDARRARDARHRSRRRDRECPALPRDDGEGADGAGDADRRRDPAGAAPEDGAHRVVLFGRRRVAALPVHRRRLLRLRRPPGRRARVRARRRGGQGAARGAPERDDAGDLRRPGGQQRLAVADDQPREPGVVSPRDRVPVRDA